MTSNMYVTLAELLDGAANDDRIRVVLWHGAGDSFCAGNDVVDFLKSPQGPVRRPRRLMKAFVNFDKPLVAAVHGSAIGGGTTMLTHCDFVYAGESAKFQMPFINLGLAPEFGSSCSLPAWLGHLCASELLLLGLPFGARAAELGLVTRVVPDLKLLATATETAQQLAAKPAGRCRRARNSSSGLRASKWNRRCASRTRPMPSCWLAGRQGSTDGVPREAAAGLHDVKGTCDGKIGFSECTASGSFALLVAIPEVVCRRLRPCFRAFQRRCYGHKQAE